MVGWVFESSVGGFVLTLDSPPLLQSSVHALNDKICIGDIYSQKKVIIALKG